MRLKKFGAGHITRHRRHGLTLKNFSVVGRVMRADTSRRLEEGRLFGGSGVAPHCPFRSVLRTDTQRAVPPERRNGSSST
ncbi:hypothetical protein BN2476_110092 [Paraburkholderia piptadeniae]|uniref:Uncharacterized protein n=1 Tax=Paraburkholderia piptadeniae TaxID=1701573 RepID=A0A1N7RPQ5_9BURK|nr:hypothetical protein BN2476_110092 [Paraburkholderia piptadeniae]